METPTTSVPATPAIPSSEGISAPNTVLFEPEAPAPVEAPVAPPPASDPWNIQTLENGQREVTLPTGQVYRGTNDEVLYQLAKAQTHASQRIAELGRQVPPPTTPPPTLPQMDPTARALADLTAQGLGLPNAEALIERMQRLEQVETGYAQQQMQQTAQQFMASAPDFVATAENGQKVDDTLATLGLEPTVKNLQVVHHYLKSTGQYVQSAPPAAPTRAPDMPLPPSGTNSVPSDPDPWSMPLDDLRRQVTGR
jgi:hypothetical protein